MTLDFYTGSIIVGIVQALLLSLSLFFKSGPLQSANRYLAILLTSCGLALVVHLLTITDYWRQYLLPYMLLSTVIFATGPNLYFYVRRMTSENTVPWYLQALHYLPLMVNLIYLSFVYLRVEVGFSNINSGQVSWFSLILPVTKIMSLTVYSVLSLRCLLAHDQRVRMIFANLGDKSLNWLRNLIFSFLLLVAIFVVLFVFQIDVSNVPGNIDTLLSAVLVGMIFMTGFYGLNQPQIFTRQLADLDIVPLNTHKEDKQGSTAESPLAQAMKPKLDELIEDYTLFQDHFLDLKMLADAVSVTPHQLSHYLNHELNSSFYEFVNQQRINHAKQLLIDSKDNILDIALNAGFSNKATFNSAFKKNTTMTPSQYRKMNS